MLNFSSNKLTKFVFKFLLLLLSTMAEFVIQQAIEKSHFLKNIKICSVGGLLPNLMFYTYGSNSLFHRNGISTSEEDIQIKSGKMVIL